MGDNKGYSQQMNGTGAGKGSYQQGYSVY